MKNKKTLLIPIVVLLIILAFVGFRIFNEDPFRFRGEVVGENPSNIPISDLPYCSFNGQDFSEEPCYAPYNEIYE